MRGPRLLVVAGIVVRHNACAAIDAIVNSFRSKMLPVRIPAKPIHATNSGHGLGVVFYAPRNVLQPVRRNGQEPFSVGGP